MSEHDDRVRLRHMLDYTREAIDLTLNRSREDLDQDRLLQLGLVRLIEIVGEAAVQTHWPGRRKRKQPEAAR